VGGAVKGGNAGGGGAMLGVLAQPRPSMRNALVKRNRRSHEQRSHRPAAPARPGFTPAEQERRSRCDSASFPDRFRNVRKCAGQAPERLVSAHPPERRAISVMHVESCFPSGLESYLLPAQAHFAPLRRASIMAGKTMTNVKTRPP